MPVLLLHGAGSNHLCWPAEIRRLADFHTVALDLPGHGKSSGVGFHDLRAYSQALFDFLAAAGWYRVFLVGHSMGGAIAMLFALNHPDHVIGLSLVSSAASFSIKSEIVESFRSSKTSAIGRQYLKEMTSPQKGNTAWYDTLQKSMQATRDSLLYADFHACRIFDIRARIKKIQAPTQVFAPTHDPMVSYAAASYVASEIKGAELVACYQNGHMLMLEEPALVSSEIGRFFERIKQGMQRN